MAGFLPWLVHQNFRDFADGSDKLHPVILGQPWAENLFIRLTEILLLTPRTCSSASTSSAHHVGDALNTLPLGGTQLGDASDLRGANTRNTYRSL